MNVVDIDVLTILPQRPPFVMVGKLLSVEELSTDTELLITDDNVFVENGTFNESGIVENIAQTCAAGMGYRNTYLNNDSVKIGFLTAVKNLIINRLPRVGESVKTQVVIVEMVQNMTLVKSRIKVGEEMIAEGEMKIFITDVDKENSN